MMNLLATLRKISTSVLFPILFLFFRCGLLSPEVLNEGLVTVRVLNVGQGLSVLISNQSGDDLLYDAGPQHASADLLSKLDSLGIDTIEVFVLSHPDADHYGGFFAVARQLPIRKMFWMNRWPYRSENEALALFCDSMQIPQYPLCAGDSLPDIDGAIFSCIWPGSAHILAGPDSVNAQSIVLRGIVGKTSFLLPGDLPSYAESLLVAKESIPPAQLLIAGHHGSRNSNSIAWLARTSPKFIAVSCGAKNVYGHPHPEVLARAAAVGFVNVLRTDLRGDLVFRTNGWGWREEKTE